MFRRTPMGYHPKVVRKTVHNLEAKIEELRTLVSELEAANKDLKRERPKEMVLEARWQAEKIVLEAKAEAADMLRLAAFRRDLIIATADRAATDTIDLTAYEDIPPAIRAIG